MSRVKMVNFQIEILIIKKYSGFLCCCCFYFFVGILVFAGFISYIIFIISASLSRPCFVCFCSKFGRSTISLFFLNYFLFFLNNIISRFLISNFIFINCMRLYSFSFIQITIHRMISIVSLLTRAFFCFAL